LSLIDVMPTTRINHRIPAWVSAVVGVWYLGWTRRHALGATPSLLIVYMKRATQEKIAMSDAPIVNDNDRSTT
jgi:hypothetical protein